jgi:NCAIR mutase (PurE)-related protein
MVMDADRLKQLLELVRAQKVEVGAAMEELAYLPFSDLGYARVDHHRALRLGVPEVILGESKTVEQLVGIAREQIRVGHNVLMTRLGGEKADQVLTEVPQLAYFEAARAATYEHEPIRARDIAPVAVVTAGTSDIPVAEEALVTLHMNAIPAIRVFDVGVAGIHRLTSELDLLSKAPALIVVAGMEGALASVVGGLVGGPVVAVPTSVGYGTALSGFTPLFGMLTGCAAGVTVVNIDNGFGAAMAVSRIVRAAATVGTSDE